MKPVIAIVGRPNVGKSTLFNRIVRRKKAIVGDEPGITRDRNYAEAEWDGGVFLLIDTGGFEPGVNDEVALHIHQQVQLAIEEADLIIFLVDGKEGLTPTDIDIAKRLREAISAQHGRGIGDLLDEALSLLPPSSEIRYNESLVKIAVLGRPNVGKSSLVNRILGNERVIVSEKPGTTRDAIDTPLKIGEKEYLLIDTAGIRRKGRISRQLEKYSVVEALKSIDRCDVAIILIDAKEGITEQDAKIAGLAHDKGRASVLVVNKWDLIEKDSYTIYKYTEDIRYNLKFIRYAPIIFVSALTGQRALKIIDLVDRVAEQYQRRVPTSELNRVFEEVILSNPPPMYRNKELKLYYTTQVSIKPPTFVIFVNYPEGIHFSYERYIVNKIRENFEFDGTPVRVFFRKRG
ncbi:MAG: engA [bacterium]|nr:MAG: engA [bacterium]